jgi:gamma-glutamylcysteine synthetase
LIILGITGAFITIPGIVDFMDAIKIEMNVNESSANDVASGIYINLKIFRIYFYFCWILILLKSFI